MDQIYLDHNSTTFTRPEVVEAMARCYAAGYANPASQHQLGQRARRVLDEARQRVAEILGADLNCLKPDRLIFTSGGTEANNLALLGLARAAAGDREHGLRNQPKCGQIIVSSVEHASVLETAEHLMETGWRLDTLPVDSQGRVQPEMLRSLLEASAEFPSRGTALPVRSENEPSLSARQDASGTIAPPMASGISSFAEQAMSTPRLVSVMLANHETGVVQPIQDLTEVCDSYYVPLHTDAVAAAGKLPINFRELGVTALSIAAHKFRGPLGIGALIVRHGIPISNILFGGHQQDGVRPGTEPVTLAVGMQTALELWQKESEKRRCRLTALRDRFESGLKTGRPGVIIHSEAADRLSNTSNIAFPGLEGQILLMALDMAGVACSVGAACASGSMELSPTLRAMGLTNGIVASSLRFSLGETTTADQVDEAVVRILDVCQQLGE
jgi:cysteine desulfurase